MPATATKKRTTLTIDARLLEAARRRGLNVSAISEAALAEEVRRAEASAWAEENAETLRVRREEIAANGMPLAAHQIWKPS